GKFDNAVEILKPARYKVVTIGGSNAQEFIDREKSKEEQCADDGQINGPSFSIACRVAFYCVFLRKKSN
ncbi:hypothetical protein P5673_033584, partial [Acropora cervicornis]